MTGTLSAQPMPPPPDGAPEAGMGWHRLDPRMIIVHPLNELLGLIPVLVGLVVFGRSDGWRAWTSAAAIGVIVVYGLVHWLTTQYRISAELVELHTGVFVRQRHSVPRSRIRTVDLTSKLGHRLFGVTAIRIGTGEHDQSGKDKLALDAVSAVEAERLRQVLLRRSACRVDGNAKAPTGVVLAQLRQSWLKFAPLTLAGLAAVATTLGASMNFARELNIDPADFGSLQQVARWLADAPLLTVIAVATGAVLVLAAVGAVVIYLVSFWGYRLTRETDNTVRVRRGLLTTRSVSIEEHRLRGVEISQPLLLRAGGGARCTAVTTGLNHHHETSLLLPPAPVSEAHRVTAAVLDEQPPPTMTPLIRHPRSALRRRLVRALAPTLALLGLLVGLRWLVGGPDWPWRTALALPPLAVLVGLDRYRNLGHALTLRYLVSRHGSLDRRTIALQRTGIIGWRVQRSIFQRRAGVITLTAITAAGGGAYHVLDIAEPDGLRLADVAVPGLLTPFLDHG